MLGTLNRFLSLVGKIQPSFSAGLTQLCRSVLDKYLIAIVMTPIPDGEAQLTFSRLQWQR